MAVNVLMYFGIRFLVMHISFNNILALKLKHFHFCFFLVDVTSVTGARGGVVVKALRYKPSSRRFDSRWCHWNFLVT